MPARSDGPTVEPRQPDAAVVRLSLAVLGDGLVATHALPAHGRVTIGRGADTDIRIDHESVSRQHVRIHIDGDVLSVEDLGSSNGTRLRDALLPRRSRVPLAAGDVIELGGVMLVVQRHATAVRPRRVWSHDAFDARLEEECERGARGRTFAVLRLRVDELAAPAIQDTVLEQVGPHDLVAWYGPNDIEILVLDTPPTVASEMLGRIRDAIGRRGGKAAGAMAAFPRDGTTSDVLLGRACDGLRSPDDPRAPVFEGAAMQSLHRMLMRVAGGTINVLLLGETGAGKEVIAERIHELSPRASRPLLKLNCAAFSDTLLESELFGHERGAFTGAVVTKPGLLETADGGTVFLDEIGDLPLALQAKLLRVIEDRKVTRVGGLEPRVIDVRFVAATHRDLEAAITQQAFRQDLYFRLNGITLVVPPLRERPDEILPLARLFTQRAARSLGLATTPEISPEAAAVLEGYPWPGNVRELRNIVERAVLLAGTDPIGPDHLPLDKIESVARAAHGSLKEGVMERERALIVDALERSGGNQTEAARLLGISRRTLVSRLSEYGLPRPRKK